jgi:hypothetical protein
MPLTTKTGNDDGVKKNECGVMNNDRELSILSEEYM